RASTSVRRRRADRCIDVPCPTLVGRTTGRYLKKLRGSLTSARGAAVAGGRLPRKAVLHPDAGQGKRPRRCSWKSVERGRQHGDRQIQPFGRNAIVRHSNTQPISIYIGTPSATARAE